MDDLKVKKYRVGAGLLLVILMVVLFYFAGLFTETIPEIEGPGGFIEPNTSKSGFLVTSLHIQPAKVQPNQILTVTVSVTNTHNTWGIYSLVLMINGVKEAEGQANVDASSSQDVSFSVKREVPGRYNVFINGLSGSFIVVALD